MGLLDSLWQGTKNVGDFVGLDGHFGYQGTWNTPTGLSSMQLNPRTAEMINNGNVPQSNSLAQYTPQNNSMLGGLANWFNNQNSQDWNNYANIAKGFGGIGLGYMNYKTNADMSKKMQDMYQQQINFNEQQINDAEARRKKAEQSMQNGFTSSGLATI